MTVTVSQLAPSSSINVILSNPDGKQTRVPAKTDATGNATVNIDGKLTQSAGTYSVDAEVNGKAATALTSVAVLPETMDTSISTLQAWTPHIRADGQDTAEITVTLRDAYGNVLPGRPVALVASRSEDVITAVTPETGKDGTQHFSLSTTKDGTSTIRAVDLLSGDTLTSTATVQAGTPVAIGGDAPSYAVAGSYDPDTGRKFYAQVSGGQTFDVIDSFEVTAPPTMAVGDEAQKVSIRAIDKNGNTVENYVGTVTFESTDPNATLPNFGSYTFKDRDLGTKSFPLVLQFKTPGPQIFRVKDSNNPKITGLANINVGGTVSHTGASGINITSYKDGDMVNSTSIIISGTGPAYANLTVMGGISDTTGQTSADGSFSIPITLAANQHDFTIRVQDDTKKNDSGPIHLILHQQPPSIGSITFSPEKPNPTDKVLVVVSSDAGLKSMTMTITDPATNTNLSVPLIENSSASGSYQAFFSAPVSGAYQPTLTATDKAGNVTNIRTTFTVGQQGLSKVMNVQTEPRVNAVALQWDSVTDPIDGYRIYVGDSPQNYLYTLDTGRVTTKATVAGLTPGKNYFFAVTAVKGTLESTDKSDPVQAQALGVTLDLTPGDGTLQVKWSSLSTDVPIANFKLEYGIAADTFTESRLINGQLRDFTIRDLLNGVPYFIRLTPITVTGDTLSDLAAKGQGTPSGTGFHAGPNDPIPGNISVPPGGKTLPTKNVSSGLPPSAMLGTAVLGLLGALYFWHRRKNLRHSEAFLQAIQAQYRK